MIIDGHAHACGEYLNAANIIANMDKNNVAKVILCPGEKDSNRNYNFPSFKKDHVYTVNKVISLTTGLSGAAKHLAELNQFVVSLCRTHPDRLLQGYWVNPNQSGVIHKISRDWNDYHFVLLKAHQCWSYFHCQDSSFKEIADWALSKKTPIFIHLKTKQDVRDMIGLCDEKRDNIFIVGHLIGIEEFIKQRSLSANVYFDISCPQLIPLEKLRLALEAFGPARLILGSDTPYGRNNIRLNIERINSLNLNATDRELILGNNLHKILTGQVTAKERP